MIDSPRGTSRPLPAFTSAPQVRLVGREAAGARRRWPFALPRTGTWKVTGVAGSGVSSLLIDTVLEAIASGADPSGILVVAPSKEAGARMRRELSRHAEDYAAQASMVRSVHSLAFALLRRGQDKELRLITGAEQDAIIREMLRGQSEDGLGSWPEEVRPALGFVGFARQLRDFLLRSIERGLGPEDLIELGRRHGRPMWAAAGDFLRSYEREQALANAQNYSAAELVSQVLLDPSLTSTHPWHTIVVDDAQLLDPMAGQLIEALAPAARFVVVGGDPEQSVFAFRGANAEFFSRFAAADTIELRQSRRTPLPTCVSIVPDQPAARDEIADCVRRRHLEDGIGWRDIAVIVRSVKDIGPVRRALLAAGVPVHLDPTDLVLAEQRLVAALLLALRALGEELSNTELEALITGPIGGADPVSLRRLIRGLRRWKMEARGIDTLRSVLSGPLPDFAGVLTERELAILERVRTVLEAGRQAFEKGGSIEEILWAVWSASDLGGRLQAAALRGGAAGSQADRDLDAVMALFDLAGDFTERRPAGSVRSFITHVVEQELPTGVRDRRGALPEAVEILTAHGSVGREWDTVVVYGAQEGSWPSLGETGSLFGQEELVDLLDDGIEPGVPVSHAAQRLAEERRLFHVATSRHRERLLVVAVDCPDGNELEEPSRFVDELRGPGLDIAGAAERKRAERRLRSTALQREMGLSIPEAYLEPRALPHEAADEEFLGISVLSVPPFVAELRRVLADQAAGEADKSQAARQLARLAQAGVPGADPRQWWDARDTAAGGVPLAATDRISPSQAETLLTCPLLAAIGGAVDAEGVSIALLRGNMAHAFFEALGRGVDPHLAFTLTTRAYSEAMEVPEWKRESEVADFERMLERIQQWLASTEGVHTPVGVEVPLRVELGPGVSITGYIDRLVREGEDYKVIDLKTSRSEVSKGEVGEHPQLLTYQLALSRGTFAEGSIVSGPGLPRAGGELVYPRSQTQTVTVREQVAAEPERLAEFGLQLQEAVAQLQGPRLLARANAACDKCALRAICPAQNEGRTVVDA